jgi:3-oxoacyl-[acyl-carrier protein] reductase
MVWGAEPGAARTIEASLSEPGAATAAIEADLADPERPARVFDEAERRLGPVTALVLSHCESVDSGLLDTTVESFDRHFAVNTRATWLLIREFGASARSAAPGGSSASPATTPSGTCPTGRARGPWTASPWSPPTSSPTSA